MRRVTFAIALALALPGAAAADSLSLGQSGSGSMGFGLDLVNPQSRYRITSIKPGPSPRSGGSLSAPASLGVSGPLSPTYGPGTQPLPRVGGGSLETSTRYQELIGRGSDVQQCQSLAKLRTGSVHGLVPGCGRN